MFFQFKWSLEMISFSNQVSGSALAEDHIERQSFALLLQILLIQIGLKSVQV